MKINSLFCRAKRNEHVVDTFQLLFKVEEPVLINSTKPIGILDPFGNVGNKWSATSLIWKQGRKSTFETKDGLWNKFQIPVMIESISELSKRFSCPFLVISGVVRASYWDLLEIIDVKIEDSKLYIQDKASWSIHLFVSICRGESTKRMMEK